MIYKYLIAFLGSFIFLNAWGVKAKPGIVEFGQPDGSVLRVILHGDENFHYATDTEGRLLQMNGNGYYVYASSGVTVKSMLVESDHSGRKGNAKYRYSTSAFPTIGNPHSLVVLVEYPDHGFNVADPKEYFEDFLNGENFSRDGATGSCREYYTENSKGEFVPTFDLYGPVMLKNNRRYYGGGNEINANKMVVEAVEALDPYVDFSQYDHNNDGYVDSIYIIYSDKGEADGGPSESVWPYSWELEEEGIFLEADGVKFNTYGVSNELQSDNQMEGVGTFIHEFGHVLGLPDLYNTDSSSDRSTPNNWSLMDSGSYNNDSRTPCNLSSFERYSLGWLDPEELVASGEYSLGVLPETNRAFIMTTEENNDEFFIAEYRMKKGWDSYLPAEGMLVWHIDFDQEAWDWNIVNNNPAHQYVSLVRADDEHKSNSYAGDPFPGNKNITEFGFDTTPALLSWAGKNLNVLSLSDITDKEERVSFMVTVNEFRGDAGIGDVSSDFKFTVTGNVLRVSEGTFTVYDLTGRLEGRVSAERPLTLNRGIYIVNGKKIII